MRIHAPKRWRWLAGTVLLARLATATTNPNTVITFLDEDFRGDDNSLEAPQGAVFTTVGYNPPRQKVFQYTSNGMLVKQIALYAGDKVVGLAYPPNSTRVPLSSDTAPSLSSSSSTSTALTSLPAVDSARPFQRRDDNTVDGKPFIDMTMTTYATGGSVVVTDLNEIGGFWGNQTMYFEALWETGGGGDYSRAFAVTNVSNTEQAFTDLENEPQFNNITGSGPYIDEFPPASETTTAPSSVASGTNESGSNGSNGKSGSGSGGHKLSSGAIAGIAIGSAAAVVIAVAAIVWLCCLRRRGLGAGPGYGDANRTQELMAEKEASAGGDGAPHSPYSDEGNAMFAHGHRADSAAGIGMAVDQETMMMDSHNHHPHAIAPPLRDSRASDWAGAVLSAGGAVPEASPVASYADADHVAGGRMSAASGAVPPIQTQSRHLSHNPDAAAAAADAGTPGIAVTTASSPGTETPQGISTQYAHLVEEDMTAEQIAQLEEEERQLDAAIAAGGRR